MRLPVAFSAAGSTPGRYANRQAITTGVECLYEQGHGAGGVTNKYEIIIYWSEEDQVFVADVPELPGCSAHGATHEAALTNAQEAIRLWIDTAREFGDPIPIPKGRRLIFA